MWSSALPRHGCLRSPFPLQLSSPATAPPRPSSIALRISSSRGIPSDPPAASSFPFSHSSLEVIGGAAGALLHGAAGGQGLRLKPYDAFPILGWNCHLETIFAAFFRSVPKVSLRRECIRTVDDGSVALDWCCGDARLLPDDAPVLILLPGLTGGSGDSYVRHMLVKAWSKGWRVVVFNSRGCGDSPVTTAQFYSASFTRDLSEVINHVSSRYPKSKLYAVGWSLGANILIRYLGQESHSCRISGAVSLCNPFNLVIADEDFHKGFNNVYDRALAGALSRIFKKHSLLFEDMGGDYNIPLAANAKSVREFDEALTRVSFGFKSVDDYYFNSSSSDSTLSSMGSLPHRAVATAIICADCDSDSSSEKRQLNTRGSPPPSLKVAVGSPRNADLKLGSRRRMESEGKPISKLVTGDNGYVLEDVPHLTDFIADLHAHPNPLQSNPSYSAVKQYFVNDDDSVSQKIVVHKSSPRGIHFRRAGPRQKVYFESDEVHACIVTCGGLCPGLNTVIREIVCGLSYMYGVHKILGIEGGYRGFYARNTITLTPKSVNGIHKRGGTVLGTSRGGHDTIKIVDSIQDRGINQVFIIGGDGTQKGASIIFEEIERRRMKVSVVGIPKTIDNDIGVIDKSFGFDTAVEEAQRAINAAHVEAESAENGIGVVKLMGRHSGFIAMYATLASRDVDCCLIPESPFYLEGPGGLFEFIEKRLKENGHMVLVVAEGAGQDLVSESMRSTDTKDPSGNKLLHDVGLWLSHMIKEHFAKKPKIFINLKYIDPTYMVRAVPSNASDNVYCTLLAHSAIHGAMAGYTGFAVGPVNGRHAYIPFYRVTEGQKKVVVTDRMWARLLSSTNQPSFLVPRGAEDPKTGQRHGDDV